MLGKERRLPIKYQEVQHAFYMPNRKLEGLGQGFSVHGSFHPLAQKIFRQEGLEFTGLENLTPGTNAGIPRGRIGADILLDAARREGRSGFAHLSEVRALLLSRL